jgi:N-methylhydantoinase B
LIVNQSGSVTRPLHVSKGEGYALREGDFIQVRTPGGGGYGDPRKRSDEAIAVDLKRGYLSPQQAAEEYGADRRPDLRASLGQAAQ